MSTATALRPWEIRRAEARAALEGKVQSILANAIRSAPFLLASERAEAERLIALPVGAEGDALCLMVAKAVDRTQPPEPTTTDVMDAAIVAGDTRANLEAELMRRGYSEEQADQAAYQWGADYEQSEGHPLWGSK